MAITTIRAILDAHGIPCFIAAGRIYSDSMQANTGLFEILEDLTDWTRAEIYSWLGY